MLPGATIAHIGVAVPDIEAALGFYRDVLGLVPQPPQRSDGALIVSLPFGPSEVELLQPLVPDSPIGRFLAKRGPGIHHICFEVDDIDAMVAHLMAKGVRMIDQVPRAGAHGCRVAFIHPAETGGVLMELSQGM